MPLLVERPSLLHARQIRLQRVVFTTLQFAYTSGIHIKTDHSIFLAKLNGQGQSYIA